MIRFRCAQTACTPNCYVMNETESKTFSDTKFVRYRIRYFFLYQIFTKPNPILFTIPNLFDTESETIQKIEKFRNQEVSKPKHHTLVQVIWMHLNSKESCGQTNGVHPLSNFTILAFLYVILNPAFCALVSNP